MPKVKVMNENDRLTMVAILAKNDYAVRIMRAKRSRNSSYDYFVKYWPCGQREPDEESTDEA